MSDREWSEGKIAAAVIGGVVGLIFLLIIFFGGWFTIQPGERGVVVTLGNVASHFTGEGPHFKWPLLSGVERVTIKQQTLNFTAECFSSDLQQVKVDLSVLFRIPEESVVAMVQKYAGDPFTSLIQPRVTEAVKEITALSSAEEIAKKREMIKGKTLELAKRKVGEILHIEDIVIANVSLSKELEDAIEQKMVQQQEAAKMLFTKQKAQVEAETAVVKAEGESKALAARALGEAQAIQIRGDALQKNPGVVQLMIAEKWNGVSPLVVGAGNGSSILLPVQPVSK